MIISSVDFDWEFMLWMKRYFQVQRNRKKKKYENFNLGKVFVLSFSMYYYGLQNKKNSRSPPWEILQFRRSDEILGVYMNGFNLLVKFKIGYKDLTYSLKA